MTKKTPPKSSLLARRREGLSPSTLRLWGKIKQTLSELQVAVEGLVTRKDLQKTERKIMSKVSDYYAAQTQFNQRLEQAIQGVEGDVRSMKEKIDKIQNSPGEISPEDQALLDELQVSAEAAVKKLEALDQLTPPEQPAPPA